MLEPPIWVVCELSTKDKDEGIKLRSACSPGATEATQVAVRTLISPSTSSECSTVSSKLSAFCEASSSNSSSVILASFIFLRLFSAMVFKSS